MANEISAGIAIDNIKYTITRLEDTLKATDLYDKIRTDQIDDVMTSIKSKLQDTITQLESSSITYTKESLTDEVWNIIIKTIEDVSINLPFNKKINSLLEKMANISRWYEDYEIVLRVKEEFDENKKINKSTIMYLNKLYKQLKEAEKEHE